MLEKDVRWRVSLSTGKNLDELKGSVYVYSDPDSNLLDKKWIGTMEFVPETPPDATLAFGRVPAFFNVEVGLPPLQYEALLTAALHGKLPKSIGVTGHKLPFKEKASFDFDELWDVASPIEIAAIDFWVSIAKNIPVEPVEPWWVEHKPGPTQSEILLNQIQALAGILDKISARAAWSVGLVLLLIIVTLLTRR